MLKIVQTAAPTGEQHASLQRSGPKHMLLTGLDAPPTAGCDTPAAEPSRTRATCVGPGRRGAVQWSRRAWQTVGTDVSGLDANCQDHLNPSQNVSLLTLQFEQVVVRRVQAVPLDPCGPQVLRLECD